MDRIITIENLHLFAFTNVEYCKRPIQGIATWFFGMNNCSMFTDTPQDAIDLAQKGILYVVPYYNPWAWSNHDTICFIEEILDVLYHTLNLSDDIPLVATGNSMGGLTALNYCVKGKHRPKACIVNCAPSNMITFLRERPETMRAWYNALYREAGTLEDAVKTISPYHLLDQMPEIPYYFFHCVEDEAVPIAQSEQMVEAMKGRFTVTFHRQSELPHCKMDENNHALFLQYILDHIFPAS